MGGVCVGVGPAPSRRLARGCRKLVKEAGGGRRPARRTAAGWAGPREGPKRLESEKGEERASPGARECVWAFKA